MFLFWDCWGGLIYFTHHFALRVDFVYKILNLLIFFSTEVSCYFLKFVIWSLGLNSWRYRAVKLRERFFFKFFCINLLLRVFVYILLNICFLCNKITNRWRYNFSIQNRRKVLLLYNQGCLLFDRCLRLLLLLIQNWLLAIRNWSILFSQNTSLTRFSFLEHICVSDRRRNILLIQSLRWLEFLVVL